MRVLDIDLDFFLADCCPLAAPGERPSLYGCEPWGEVETRAFLEKNCGLSREKPVPGRIYQTHDGSLRMWGELIGKGRLVVPFEVTHVDAHSDLGIGVPGPGLVLDGVLPVNMKTRAEYDRYYDREQLDEANYLLFALAFRWIARLENVRAPRSRKDFPKELVPRGGENGIRLTSFASRLLEGANGREPLIEYEEFTDYGLFAALGAYDFVSLALSPRYAPAEADALIPVIAEYIDLI